MHDKEPQFLLRQIELFPKFIDDEYEWVVLNNAADAAAAKEIERLCLEHRIQHIVVPEQHHENPNVACSYPLDYLMQHFIRPEERATISVIIDSDMFPLQLLSFAGLVGAAEIAAVFQSRGRFAHDSPANQVRYLWNGLVIFNHSGGQDFSKVIWASSACGESPYYPHFLFDTEGRIEGEWVDVGGATHAYLRDGHAVKYIDWVRVEASRHNLHLIPGPLRLLYQPFYHNESSASDFLVNGAIFHYRAGSNWNQLLPHLIQAKKVMLDRLIAGATGNAMDRTLDRARQSAVGEGSRVLIAICSCHAYSERRRAVRETWLSTNLVGMEAVFFVGMTEFELPTADETDLVVVDTSDDYEHLPEKVVAFFRYALAHHEFDWIFKCDDDTYVVPERLSELTRGDHDLAGNEFLESSGYASGGAGYLLSRELVKILTNDATLATTGAEDMIISGAAVMAGARGLVTNRLGWDGCRIPRRDNDQISTHWLAPDQMRAVHTIFTEQASSKIDFVGSSYRSRIHFHDHGAFCQETGPGYGLWDLDDEANLVLEFAPGREREVCSVGELFANEPVERLRIGALVIATGRYRSLIARLVESVEKNFLPQYERTIFLFTDADQVPRPGVQVIRISNRPWPGMALQRYGIFRDHADTFDGMDYLYYLDADMRVTGYVGNEILSDLTAVIHPSFEDSKREAFTYEDNSESNAYIPPCEGSHYFCGGVQGGRRRDYLAAACNMAEKIDDDLKRGIVAKWHDESHWNRYLIDHPPTKILTPSYCHPEGYKMRFPEKITALDKDHAAFRDTERAWPSTIVARLGGGIGNQMFCYANGLALARFFGAALELRYGPHERGYALEPYGIELTPECEDVCYTFNDLHGFLPGGEVKVRDAIIASRAARVRVEGYYQNERYFENVAGEVRRRFQVRPRLPVPCCDKTPVCLQVRRGDYVGNAKFDLCTEQYYRDGMAIVNTFVENPLWFVVSDDLDWCRQWFAGCDGVVVPERQTAVEAMQTMQACKALVISNSSFGWWGAWLSEASLVVAPEPWLGDQHWDCVPPRWIRLPVAGCPIIVSREDR